MADSKKPSTGMGSLGDLLSKKLGVTPTPGSATPAPAAKSSAESALVYSTDPSLNEKCPRCRQLKANCACEAPADVKAKWVAYLRLEKNGRGGKTVTVISELPKNEVFLKDWCTKLKKRCGSGGTYDLSGKEGVIEIQGDHREAIRKAFTDAGFKTKGN